LDPAGADTGATLNTSLSTGMLVSAETSCMNSIGSSLCEIMNETSNGSIMSTSAGLMRSCMDIVGEKEKHQDHKLKTPLTWISISEEEENNAGVVGDDLVEVSKRFVIDENRDCENLDLTQYQAREAVVVQTARGALGGV
jgi:hypothetical protein